MSYTLFWGSQDAKYGVITVGWDYFIWDKGRNTTIIVICGLVVMQNKWARNPYIINTCNCWLKPLFRTAIYFIFCFLPEALKGLWLKLLSFAEGKCSSCYYFPSLHLTSSWNSSKLHGLPQSWFLDFLSPYFDGFPLSNSKNKT